LKTIAQHKALRLSMSHARSISMDPIDLERMLDRTGDGSDGSVDLLRAEANRPSARPWTSCPPATASCSPCCTTMRSRPTETSAKCWAFPRVASAPPEQGVWPNYEAPPGCAATRMRPDGWPRAPEVNGTPAPEPASTASGSGSVTGAFRAGGREWMTSRSIDQDPTRWPGSQAVPRRRVENGLRRQLAEQVGFGPSVHRGFICLIRLTVPSTVPEL